MTVFAAVVGGLMVLATAYAQAMGPDYTNYDPNLEFNLTLSDMHGIYKWDVAEIMRTFGDVQPLPARWNASFSNSSWSDYVPGMVGLGTSEHRVTVNSTEWFETFVLPSFIGTRFTVMGAINSTAWPQTRLYTPHPPLSFSMTGPIGEALTWSNVTSPPSGDVLGSVSYPASLGLSAELTCYDGTLSITGVTMTAKMKSAAPSFADVDYTAQPFVVNGSRSRFARYRGPWNVTTHIGGVGGQAPIAYPHLQGFDGAELSFDVPRNTSFMYINGTLGPWVRKANVWIDPAPPTDVINGNNGQVSSPWVVPDAIIYMNLLDPTIKYNITVTPVMITEGDTTSGDRVTLHSVTFFSALSNKTVVPSNTTQAPIVANVTSAVPSITSIYPTAATATAVSPIRRDKLSPGAIAGIVVGVVAGAFLIAFIVAWAARRRRRRRSRKPSRGDRDGFVIDTDTKGSGSDDGLVAQGSPRVGEKKGYLSEQHIYPGGGISPLSTEETGEQSLSANNPNQKLASMGESHPSHSSPAPLGVATTHAPEPNAPPGPNRNMPGAPAVSPHATRSPRPLPTPTSPRAPLPPLERVRVQQERDGGTLRHLEGRLPGYSGRQA